MSIGFFETMKNRRQIRAPKNALDKSTVFSILQKEVREVKPTLDPGIFQIAPGMPDKPSRLVVGSSSWWREIDLDQPLLEIPVSSIQIAESVVRDYSNGVIMCDMGETRPGLFFLPGDVSIEELKTKFEDVLNQAIKRQENWFRALVKLADSFWARTNGNPLSISDDSRLAARMLKIEDRPWLMDFKLENVQIKACPACGSLRNNAYPVCANCKTVIDSKKFTELGLKFAS
jgi:hypothetical protein